MFHSEVTLVQNRKLIEEFEYEDADKHYNYVIIGQKDNQNNDWDYEKIDSGYMVYAGSDSPLSQCIGTGFGSENRISIIDKLEEFYFSKKCDVNLELNIAADNELRKLLIKRGYKKMEQTNVLIKSFTDKNIFKNFCSNVKVTDNSNIGQVVKIITKGFTEGIENEKLQNLFHRYYEIDNIKCFHYKLDDKIVGGGFVSLSENFVVLRGASTLVDFRRRGIQTELIKARINYGLQTNRNSAIVVVLENSPSEKNYFKNGFVKFSERSKYHKPYKN